MNGHPTLHGLVAKSVADKLDNPQNVASFAMSTKEFRSTGQNALKGVYSRKARDRNGYGVWVCQVDGVYKFLERTTGRFHTATTVWMGIDRPYIERSGGEFPRTLVPDDAHLTNISNIPLSELNLAISHLNSIIEFVFPETFPDAEYLNMQIKADEALEEAREQFGHGSAEFTEAANASIAVHLDFNQGDHHTDTSKLADNVFKAKMNALKLWMSFQLVRTVAQAKNPFGDIVGGRASTSTINCTCTELRLSAKRYGVKGVSKMTKPQLLKVIAAAKRKQRG